MDGMPGARALRHAARTATRLRELGMLDPRRGLAAALVAPWLVRGGPTLALAARIHARSRPADVAIVDRHGPLTWAELDHRVNRLSRGLRTEGITPGDAVATVLRNGREIVEVLLATQRLGLAAMPLNTWASADELSAILERSQPSALVVDDRHAEQLPGEIAAGTSVLVVGEGLSEAAGYESTLRRHNDSPPPSSYLERGARVIIHTSGTTGLPKAAERDIASSGVGTLLGLVERVPYRHDDKILCPAPLFHSFGLLTLSTAIVIGATLVLPDRFEPQATLDEIDRGGVTAVSLVPIMLKRLVDLQPGRRVGRLRILLTSGSMTSPELRAATRRMFGDVHYDLYGSTEAGWIAIATPADIIERPDAVGRPVAGVEVAIADDAGRHLPPGETGRILVNSRARFEGYASGEDVPEERGYLDTGDLGRLEDERLFVVGRADDMAVIGGENVYPVEVEQVIATLDGVDDVTVLAEPHEEYGEVLAAFVVGEIEPDTVREACRRALASYKVPRRVEIVDALPRTATGKVMRRALLGE